MSKMVRLFLLAKTVAHNTFMKISCVWHTGSNKGGVKNIGWGGGWRISNFRLRKFATPLRMSRRILDPPSKTSEEF